MRKNKGYLLTLLLCCICMAGIVLSRLDAHGQNGTLGDQIIYFGQSNGGYSAKAQNVLEDSQGNESWTILESGGGESASHGTSRAVIAGKSAASHVDVDGDGQKSAIAGDTPSVPASTPKPSYPPITSDEKAYTYDTGTVVVGDAGYEIYNYVSSAADRYAKTINKLTKTLDSGVEVYNMLAPTSMGITYPDNKKKQLHSSSQEVAMDNIEKMLSGRENFIPLYDALMKHRQDDIFFRTDHHWTQLGAYYAYEAFCREKGMVPNPLKFYKKKSFPGFLGSFYRDSKQNKNLKAKKDTLQAYYPMSRQVSLEYTNTEGKKGNAPVIADGKNYGEGMKYLVYIAGDNPYTVVKNKDKHDGTSCILVKESYGNAFVPYLVDHYETIYVIDYRYWEGKLDSFVKSKRAKEVIVLNNISMTRSSYLVGKLAQIIS